MVAPVILQVIHAPRSIGPRILKLVPASAGKTRTGLCPRTIVDAELESFRMKIIADGLHPVWKSFGIGNQITQIIPVRGFPAVINHDVIVAGFLHPGGNHGVGYFLDQLFINVHAERVPTVPAHRRRGRQSGKFLGQNRGGQTQNQEQNQFFHFCWFLKRVAGNNLFSDAPILTHRDPRRQSVVTISASGALRATPRRGRVCAETPGHARRRPPRPSIPSAPAPAGFGRGKARPVAPWRARRNVRR